ncbi:hypothetical protein [Streptomyces sp. NPDC096153]|uniref:hypothetical protein n=1 Tax=Streptomyces sp. NPDC096153 TaxID=3155548 RepID=UPI00332E4D18
MERTQHATSREAPPSDDARAIINRIVGRLTTERPDATIDDARRMALALTYATDQAGFRTAAADSLEREVLIHMPRIEQPITRGEYALIVRHAIQA